MSTNPAPERLHDLLIQQVTEPLEASELNELRQLLAAHRLDPDTYALIVAELDIARARRDVAIPPDLARRVTAVGEAYVDGTPRAKHAEPRRAPLGWYAAAASLILAVLGWYPRLVAPPPATPVAAVTQPKPAPVAENAAQARAALLEKPGLVRTALTGTADPDSAPIDGDVVWDPKTQHGYLRLRGLPVNDPSQTQYQLWVFDAERDQKYPVDGGVFDIPATGVETVVPIRVPLKVGQVVLFAVTVERPGGVVVSGREHIVATAKPGAT